MRCGKVGWLGILLWVVIFIEISLTKIAFGLSDLAVWTTHYILLIPFAVFIASRYYKCKDRVNGFVLGLVVVIVGIVLDAIITVPFFMNGHYSIYFSQPTLLVGFFEAIVIFGVYDILRR